MGENTQNVKSLVFRRQIFPGHDPGTPDCAAGTQWAGTYIGLDIIFFCHVILLGPTTIGKYPLRSSSDLDEATSLDQFSGLSDAMLHEFIHL
jgi:hypothetical protein